MKSTPIARGAFTMPENSAARRGAFHVARVLETVPREQVKVPDGLPERVARAVVWPWKSDKAQWHELRYSLRSVAKFFADRHCPLYVVGDRKPDWMDFGPSSRVRFVKAVSYPEAVLAGVNLADEVLWMNDDICLLQFCDWDSFLPAPRLETYTSQSNMANFAGNQWRRGLGTSIRELLARGKSGHNFSTHTPYLYERAKVMELLGIYGLWHKITLETLYFNHYALPSYPIGKLKARALPAPEARFLNYTDNSLTPALKQRLAALLPDQAPWERNTVAEQVRRHPTYARCF